MLAATDEEARGRPQGQCFQGSFHVAGRALVNDGGEAAEGFSQRPSRKRYWDAGPGRIIGVAEPLPIDVEFGEECR
jgi:hypothetical protein